MRIKIRDLWLFACTGIFSIVLFNFCYYKTMSLSTLSVAAVLLYTAPFFVMFISVPLFKEKFTLKKIGACLIAFVGCVLVSGVTGQGVRLTPACLGFGLMTGFGYALYTVFGELLLRRGYPSLTITFYTFVFALIGTLPFVFKDLIQLALTPAAIIPLGAVPVAIAMALFNTVFPYLLYTGGLKTVAPDRAPIIATVEPVVATLVGLVIFSEYPSVAGWIGIVLVVFAVIFLNLETGKKHETEGICKTESNA
ncbi:MAG: EamA family transporter [Clostridia bacterium]|nr:EamA family transporter [Clostridia bacterium]